MDEWSIDCLNYIRIRYGEIMRDVEEMRIELMNDASDEYRAEQQHEAMITLEYDINSTIEDAMTLLEEARDYLKLAIANVRVYEREYAIYDRMFSNQLRSVMDELDEIEKELNEHE